MAQATGAQLEALISEYSRAYDEFEALGGYDVDQRIAAVLEGLGLGTVPEDTPLSALSGGQRTRAGLAGVIASEPTVLLLDEPTNHLDVEALEWLESWLSAYEGAVSDRVSRPDIFGWIRHSHPGSERVAHGHGRVPRQLLRLPARQKSVSWKSRPRCGRTRRRRREDSRDDIAQTKQTALRTETSTTHDFYRRRAKKVAQKAKARESRLERMLASTDRVERPKPEWTMRLEFGRMPRGGSRVLALEDVGHDFDGRWLFRDTNLTLEHGERIALLGPNGCGKTTLLRIVAENARPSLGAVRLGANVKIGYMPQDQAGLDWSMSALSIVRAVANVTETEARTFLHQYLFEGDDSLLPAASLSYGQRSRLLLAKLVLEGVNFLVLDEPVNHLDIPSREQFEDALDAFPGTVLMALHDRALIDKFATGIWVMEDGTIRRYADRRELASIRAARARARRLNSVRVRGPGRAATGRTWPGEFPGLPEAESTARRLLRVRAL